MAQTVSGGCSPSLIIPLITLEGNSPNTRVEVPGTSAGLRVGTSHRDHVRLLLLLARRATIRCADSPETQAHARTPKEMTKKMKNQAVRRGGRHCNAQPSASFPVNFRAYSLPGVTEGYRRDKSDASDSFCLW